MNEFVSMWKNYFNFKDRTTVRGYWMAILFNIIALIILGVLMSIADIFGILYVIYCIAAIIPSLSIQVRRLHDINKSGFWIFITVIPLVGTILYLIWLCKGSVDEENRFGTAQV
jgi:uncharacterized membrane protein YhaH (DUF805 family)